MTANAKRQAYAWVVYAIDMADEHANKTGEGNTSLAVGLEIMKIRGVLKAASEIEDGDLTALEDGKPIIGKCLDPDCKGPHLSDLNRAPYEPHCSRRHCSVCGGWCGGCSDCHPEAA